MLTEEQLTAATVDHSIALMAGPGTGKTATVVGRVSHLLESGVQPHEIVVFTFTRRAGKELRERLGDAARGMFIGTFHSVMLDAMAACGRRLNVLDADAADAALDECAKMLGHASEVKGSLAYTKRSRAYWRGQVDACRLGGEVTKQGQELAVVYGTQLKLNGDIDYCGILSMGLELIEATPLMLAKEVIVDEAQDTDSFQWKIVHKLAERATVWASGDSRQVLYQWRGVSPELFLDLPWQRMAITKSFRCPWDVIQAANRIAKVAGDPSPELQVVESEHRAIRTTNTPVVHLVRRLLGDMYASHEIAVLCRYNEQVAHHSNQIQAAGLNIAIARKPPGGPVHRLLAYLASPRSQVLRENCARAWEPYHLSAVPPVVENICRADMSLHSCALLAESWLARLGVFVGPAQVMEAITVPHMLWSDAEFYKSEYADCTLEQFAKEASGIYGAEMSEQQGIAVLTIHQAKGLEWPVVIMPDLDDGVFPRNPDKINNEDRRLFFVGITRTMEQLFLQCGNNGKSPSMFIKEAGIEFSH